MARYELIDDHLASLRRRLGWRSDADDVEAELRDHLYSAVERLEGEGHDRGAAQRFVIDRFGAPGPVAGAFAASGVRGLAVPTEFTRSAGVMMLVAAALWLAVPLGWWASHVLEDRQGGWARPAQIVFVGGAMALLPAAILSAIGIGGLIRRHAGLGVLGWAGIAACALGAAASFVAWFVYGWALLLGVGAALVAVALRRRGLAPRLACWSFGSAWLAGGLTLALAQVAKLGGQDEWGDWPVAVNLGLTVGSLLFAAGLAGLGWWLRAETPVEPAALGALAEG